MHELVKNNIKKIFNKVGGASKESQCWDEHDICISVPRRSCEIPRVHVRANTEKMRDCHLIARTCDNEVYRRGN